MCIRDRSNSSATAALTVQAGAKVANVTAASLSVSGKNAVIELSLIHI